jgi:protein OPY2
VFNALVYPPFVIVACLRPAFKLHSTCIGFIPYVLRVLFSTSTFRSCTACSTFQCVIQLPASSPDHGVSAGVIAGAVVGALVFLSLPIGLFFWWRRQTAVPVQPPVPEVKDIPAPADTVLNRPDPTEVVVTPGSVPVVRVYPHSNSTINLDPSSQSPPLPRRDSSHSNPFGDGHSIQTTSTSSQSTNVIPIAFVPPPASVLPAGSNSQPSSIAPLRPQHMQVQGVGVNIDHMNLSSDSVPGNPSLPSLASVMADDRSYITNASYASDVISDVPTIVTGRQVVSTAKAAVVIPPSQRSLTSRPSIRSPLTATSFGPQDILHEAEDHPLPIPTDPFADERSPAFRSSMATHGSSSAPQDFNASPTQHSWNADPDINDSDRPLSTYTQAASVIGANIMDATRVHLGFVQPTSAPLPGSPMASSVGAGPVTLVRMASGRLVSRSNSSATNHLERQQENALAAVQAQTQQQEKGQANPYRMSMSTMASGVSGRADSILECFTFVPPSPISNRPLRTPPRSPLAQETPNVPSLPATVQDDSDLEPPNRQILGMSTGSQLSAMSTGLGSFPFQIDHGSDGSQGEEPPVGVPLNERTDAKSKQRASLDTLALTKDLASYPLGFDRQSKESFAAFMASKN